MFGFCCEEKVELEKMDSLLRFAWLQVKNRSVMAINAVETTLAKLKSDDQLKSLGLQCLIIQKKRGSELDMERPTSYHTIICTQKWAVRV